MSKENRPVTDEDLTAYLDGAADDALSTRIAAALETDPELAMRHQALTIDLDILRSAYDFDSLRSPAPPENLAAIKTSLWKIPAALAATFALGMVAMALLRPAPDWVDTVASYQALYVTETLSGPTQPTQKSAAVLGQAKEMLGVDLGAAIDINGLTFKRAQILAIDGQPLIQIAYLDDDGVPFAFCITAASAGGDMRQVMSHDLATQSWVDNGIGYVLVGGTDLNRVGILSAQFRGLL
ncbi:anti-sigma factor family protein [Yoonia sp. 2307UL14-13]|uniref:anti-sigma factor family protein n=1 Tax=Yoonia sp. 2307UL14-13 TaxID=3126506 RepID=UPI0030A1C018